MVPLYGATQRAVSLFAFQHYCYCCCYTTGGVRGDEERGMLAELLGGHLLQALHRRVGAVHVVAHLRGRDGLAHGRPRLRDRVGQHVHRALDHRGAVQWQAAGEEWGLEEESEVADGRSYE